jgi:hypothetical protein
LQVEYSNSYEKVTSNETMYDTRGLSKPTDMHDLIGITSGTSQYISLVYSNFLFKNHNGSINVKVEIKVQQLISHLL